MWDLVAGELAVLIPILAFYFVTASLDILHGKGDNR